MQDHGWMRLAECYILSVGLIGDLHLTRSVGRVTKQSPRKISQLPQWINYPGLGNHSNIFGRTIDIRTAMRDFKVVSAGGYNVQRERALENR